jgi:hypothetical protein
LKDCLLEISLAASFSGFLIYTVPLLKARIVFARKALSCSDSKSGKKVFQYGNVGITELIAK